MAQEITNFFAPRANRGSVTRSPVKPRTSSSTSSGPASALKTISNNSKSYPISRDIAVLSPSKRELFVFRDPSPKPRKTSDTENSDALTSSQDSNHSSDSSSGNRKVRSSKKHSHKPPSPLPRLAVETRDEGAQTDELTESRIGEDGLTGHAGLPIDAFDLLSDEPSENYYKDLAEARREALAETLEENQNLHDLNEQLQGERDRLSESFNEVFTASEKMKSELERFSRLNETLEEENRLLKEALGLEDDAYPEND